MKEKKEKKKLNIPFLICLIVLIGAVAFGIVYKVRQNQKESVYEDLAAEVMISETEEEEEDLSVEEEEETVSIPIDFETLWETNEDIYAWIHIEGTVIDYPIVQSADDDKYYLYRTVDGEEGLPGSIYTKATYNGTDFTDNVTVIYGHNMRDDSMFGSLSEYQDEDYREEHSEIIIYTPEHILTYEIVCAVTYDNRLISYAFDLDNALGYAEFLDSLQYEHYIPSWTADPFDVSTDDRMIILSTCNGNSDQRYLIGAVLVSEE